MTPTDAAPLLLLVDDVPANLHLLATVLRSDYRIKAATNGRMALEIAAKEDRPDLILLDVMMPEMDGIEVLERLREDPHTSGIPVFFVSADSREHSQLRGLELGADDYLIKPIVSKVLQVRVRSLLDRKRVEARLRLAAHVFDHSGEAILIVGRDHRVVDANSAFTRVSGLDLDELRGEDPGRFFVDRPQAPLLRTIWGELDAGAEWRGEVWMRYRDGDAFPVLLTASGVRDEMDEVEFGILNFADISAQKDTEKRILHMAHHDVLTGLPNRLYLEHHFESIIHEAAKSGDEVALLFLDLDHFKDINDTLGHQAGDRVLVEVARRLQSLLRRNDRVARLGGDEFVVIVRERRAVNAAARLGDRILHRLSRPIAIEDRELRCTTSIGVSAYPRDGECFEELAKNADSAMYQAKSEGRNVLKFHDSDSSKPGEAS